MVGQWSRELGMVSESKWNNNLEVPWKVSRAEGMDRRKPGRVHTDGSEGRLLWLQR